MAFSVLGFHVFVFPGLFFPIWSSQSLRLLNTTTPIGWTGAAWSLHRTGNVKLSPFCKVNGAEAS